MVDGGVDAPPPVKRKRGRPRKADILAAQQAAGIVAAPDGGAVPAPTLNGVPAPVPNALGVPAGLKPEPKPRKSRKKKGEILPPPGVDQTLVGKTVTGVLDGSFDAGYLVSVRVGDSETVLRGVVFGPGLTVPLAKHNDVALGVKVVKRDETLPVPAAAPFPALAAPGAAAPTSAHPSQTPAAPAAQSQALPSAAAVPKAQAQALPSAAVPKAVSAPAGPSLPAVAAPDSNSQGNPTQGSVQPAHPTPVPQATPAA